MERLATRTARIRQIEELLLVAHNGMKVSEISKKLNVNRRTIYRDLEFLSEEGVPVWQANGRYGINRTHYQTTIRLTFHESVALVLAGLLLSRNIDERNQHVITALRKLATTLPHPLAKHLTRAAQRVQANIDKHQQVKVLETIAEGWGNGHKVEVMYRSPRSGSIRPRTISPYAIEPTNSGIYVICHDEWANDLRTFKLDRLESAKILYQTFDIPDNFNLEEHLAHSWGIMSGKNKHWVVLRFAPEAVSLLYERHWHPSQHLESLPNGDCILRVEVSQPVEMMPWIRGWGANVEILEPKWLRLQMVEDLQKAAQLYGLTEPDPAP